MHSQANLTEDYFLGGRLRLLQPGQGYRAGVDPVLLAAAVPAQPGERVLDLGCGVGAVALCLGARVRGLRLFGVDLLPENVDLARRNAQANDLPMEVVQGDVGALPAALRQQSFDHVVSNPPYFRRTAGPASDGVHRDTAMGEGLALSEWIEAGIRRVNPKGRLSLIMSAERLPEILAAFENRLGDVMVLPLAARVGRDAGRVIVTGRKGARAPFRLLAPLVLHVGDHHDGDREDYTAQTRAILRDGAALSLVDRAPRDKSRK
ncbi:MAG: methyltransferase [Mangrovicoccus sp.]|nr:methyltransferase [Mangrovicoccus sp.]